MITIIIIILLLIIIIEEQLKLSRRYVKECKGEGGLKHKEDSCCRVLHHLDPTEESRENGITVQMRGDQSMNPELSAELRKKRVKPRNVMKVEHET